MSVCFGTPCMKAIWIIRLNVTEITPTEWTLQGKCIYGINSNFVYNLLNNLLVQNLTNVSCVFFQRNGFLIIFKLKEIWSYWQFSYGLWTKRDFVWSIIKIKRQRKLSLKIIDIFLQNLKVIGNLFLWTFVAPKGVRRSWDIWCVEGFSVHVWIPSGFAWVLNPLEPTWDPHMHRESFHTSNISASAEPSWDLRRI